MMEVVVQKRYVPIHHDFITALRVTIDKAKAEGTEPDRAPVVAAFLAQYRGQPSRSQLFKWAQAFMGPERSFPSRKGKPNPNQARHQAGARGETFTKVETPAAAPGPITDDQERTGTPPDARGIIPFDFKGHQVRTVVCDGEPLFVAFDVATLLGYANQRDAVATHCKAARKVDLNTVADRDGIRGNPNVTVIPERDVYRLVMRSHLPAAEEFEEWVVGTVLPSIRKNGGYIAGQERLATGEESREEFLARAQLVAAAALHDAEEARRLAEERAITAQHQAHQLQEQVTAKDRVIQEQAPKVATLHAIAADIDHVSYTEAWHILEFNKRDDLRDFLIRHKWAHPLGGGNGKLVPNADARRAGWVTDKTALVGIKRSDGTLHFPVSLRITKAGLVRAHVLKAHDDALRGVRAKRASDHDGADDQGSLPV